MDRGLSLRSYLWLAGCGFLVAGCLAFAAFLRLNLPWWAMAMSLGVLVGAVVLVLEHALARPLERLAKVSFRIKEGLAAPPPGGLLSAQEVRRVWKAVRTWQEQFMQARHAQKAAETQLSAARAHLEMLSKVTRTLLPDVPVAEAAPPVLRDLAAALGLRDIYLVPLRRHCPVPVVGGHGEPAWGAEVRATGFGPWEALLDAGVPNTICLSPVAPMWREHFGERPVWVVPLVYHGKAQGLLLAPVTGPERTWTPDELELVGALARVLAAGLHPPRWSEERASRRPEEQVVAELEAVAGRPRRSRRRRSS